MLEIHYIIIKKIMAMINDYDGFSESQTIKYLKLIYMNKRINYS